MMKNVLGILCLSGVLLSGVTARADSKNICEVTVTRIPCKGKDAESFKKSDGKPTSTNPHKKSSLQSCTDFAKSECAILRPGVTKAKEVTAKFEGNAIEGGKNLCAADRPDFNKCE